MENLAEPTTDTHPAVTEYEQACDGGDHGDAIRDVLGHIGDKWALLIVGALDAGVRMRFTEVQRHIPGISQRMLTVTLRQLERDGLVTRTAHAEVPPRVEYELTTVGTTLIEPARSLAHWAMGSYDTIMASRERFDARAERKRSTAGTGPGRARS
jgi:DNA-binding HxlR family transcriptional regulator